MDKTPYVVYGVKYIDLVSPAPLPGLTVALFVAGKAYTDDTDLIHAPYIELVLPAVELIAGEAYPADADLMHAPYVLYGLRISP